MKPAKRYRLFRGVSRHACAKSHKITAALIAAGRVR